MKTEVLKSARGKRHYIQEKTNTNDNLFLIKRVKETQRLCFPGILILFFFFPRHLVNYIIHQLWALRIRFNFTYLLPQVFAMRDFSRLCFVLHRLANWGKKENWYQFRKVNSYEPPTVCKALCLLGAWKAVLFYRAHCCYSTFLYLQQKLNRGLRRTKESK